MWLTFYSPADVLTAYRVYHLYHTSIKTSVKDGILKNIQTFGFIKTALWGQQPNFLTLAVIPSLKVTCKVYGDKKWENFMANLTGK